MKKKRKFIIETSRTEYHTCRYVVEAVSKGEAKAIFDDPDHEEYDPESCQLTEDKPVDGFEDVAQVYTESEARSAGFKLTPEGNDE